MSTSRMFRKVGKGLALVVVLVVVVPTAIGALLPRDHVASSTIAVPANCGEVFATITDPAGWPAWHSGTDEVHVDPGGGRYVQVSGGDALAFLVDEVRPPELYRTRIEDNPVFGGTWTFELAGPDPCEVRITERGFVSLWPARLFSVAMGHHGAMDQTLHDLAAHHGGAGEPRHVEPPP